MVVSHFDFSLVLLERRKRCLWSDDECVQLRLGVEQHGNNWEAILKSFKFNDVRTRTDLGNKWRSMEKKVSGPH
jgi:hypothetical protein